MEISKPSPPEERSILLSQSKKRKATEMGIRKKFPKNQFLLPIHE